MVPKMVFHSALLSALEMRKQSLVETVLIKIKKRRGLSLLNVAFSQKFDIRKSIK